jgi:hypothetical protein
VHVGGGFGTARIEMGVGIDEWRQRFRGGRLVPA